jgi:PTH1 family peptidyl-tRNA hydrolase
VATPPGGALSENRPERAHLVVVGLGNPGPRYERTRHNAGTMAIAALAERTGARLRGHRSGCLVAETALAGRPVVVARTLDFMNDSGRAVGALVRWYKAPAGDLVVVHDELDIPFGDVRVKWGGGTAGHNGLRSVSSHLGTKDFGRVRIGISRPPGRVDPVSWVLSEFSAAERKELPWVIGRAADAVERIAEVGLDAAMNEFNTRARSPGLQQPSAGE